MRAILITLGLVISTQSFAAVEVIECTPDAYQPGEYKLTDIRIDRYSDGQTDATVSLSDGTEGGPRGYFKIQNTLISVPGYFSGTPRGVNSKDTFGLVLDVAQFTKNPKAQVKGFLTMYLEQHGGPYNYNNEAVTCTYSVI